MKAANKSQNGQSRSPSAARNGDKQVRQSEQMEMLSGVASKISSRVIPIIGAIAKAN